MRVAASKLITFISTFKELTTPFVEINKWLSGQPCDQRYLNFGLLSVVAVFFNVFLLFFRVCVCKNDSSFKDSCNKG